MEYLALQQKLYAFERCEIYIEQLEEDPSKYLPEVTDSHLDDSPVVKVDLNQPMSEIRKLLSKDHLLGYYYGWYFMTANRYPIRTRLSLTGTLVVARDIAHAKLKERIEKGQGLPDRIFVCCQYD